MSFYKAMDDQKRSFEYGAVAAESIVGLVIEVNKLIEEGWRPLGGLVEGHFFFYQAMVKDDMPQHFLSLPKTKWGG